MLRHRRHRVHQPKIVPYRHTHFRFTLTGLYLSGKRVRRFFRTRTEAETFLQQFRIKQENLGTRATTIDQSLHVMAIECSDRLKPHGRTIADATNYFLQHLEATRNSRTVEELIPEFLKSKQADGKNQKYVQAMFFVLRRFQRTFARRLVAEITTAEIDDWLRALTLQPLSRNNHRRVVGTFFNYAVVRRYCPQNPVQLSTKVKVVSKPIGILTPPELGALLEKADPSIRPALAIGAFAGLRPAEITRLAWKEVMLDRGYIEVTAAKAKTASRRLVKILPNLRAWLEIAPTKTGSVMPPNYRKLTDAGRLAAGLVEWPSNALRHSYASYHLAKFQDAAALALEMGHSTTAILFAHYREVVTPQEASSYWKLVPSGVTD